MDSENVLIIIDTGFVGGVHEVQAGCTVKEWNALSLIEQQNIYDEVTSDYIEVHAVIDNEERTIL